MSSRALCRTRICGEYVSPTFKFPNIRCASTAPPKGFAKVFDHQLAYYWDTAPPTTDQLRQAKKFFNGKPPQLLFSSTAFRTVQDSDVPEVAFLGRSNVGKSSLINALVEHKVCHVSSKSGRTKSMNFFAVGGEDECGSPGKVVVLDMPGYGHASREEWGREVMKYLVERKQLRRVFLLVDALHGLKPTDVQLLSLFRQNAVSHQIILSKADRILFGKHRPSVDRLDRSSPDLIRICQRLRSEIQPGYGDGPEALGEILAFSAQTTLEGRKLGINNVRWAVLVATGLSQANKKLLPSELSTVVPDDGGLTRNTTEWTPFLNP